MTNEVSCGDSEFEADIYKIFDYEDRPSLDAYIDKLSIKYRNHHAYHKHLWKVIVGLQAGEFTRKTMNKSFQE